MSEILVLLGIVVAAVSGLPGMVMSRSSIHGQWSAVILSVLASACGLFGAALFWCGGHSEPIAWPWLIPGAAFSVAVDGLSAFFLIPIFFISALGSVYGLDYWRQTEHEDTGSKLRLLYGIATAGMALLVIARDSVVFLFGWEVMALSAFLLVATEDHDPEVRETGWIYLLSTHTATLLLFALFAIMRAVNGSFALEPLSEDRLDGATATIIFALALAGFGFKAGMMPLHIWLPSAHAIAPSHVSALMSGVIIKMGIYGLVRVTSLLPSPPIEWGGTVLGLGVVSGVFGVVFAIAQHDLKRLLAYHSIENIGIMLMGLGVALMGRSLHRSDLIVLGLAGCLLHVWNHALFKSLLFLCAGSVIHATRSRELDQLGGLSKVMPWTALGFGVGAVAICGLPPLNGFVSEFLIYLGFFAALEGSLGASLIGVAFAAAALAMIGALASACFVKVHGIVFLGQARSDGARQAHESPWSMTAPIAVLAACCCWIGLAPRSMLPMLGHGIAAWAPELGDASERLAARAPLGWITLMGVALVLLLALGALWLWDKVRQGDVAQAPTWSCGYAAPSAHMQYTASSFAQMIVGLFAWALLPRADRPAALAVFPDAASFHSDVPDTVLDRGVLPTFRFGDWLMSWVRVLQQGNIQAYLLYIFITLVVMLMWR